MKTFAILFAGLLLYAGPAYAQGTAPSAVPSPAAVTASMRVGDVLQIRIWPDSSLGGSFVVEESGMVHLPALGEVRAAGVPLPELRAQLRQLYREALRSPSISVTPLYRVSVLGAVQRPGLYHVDPTQSLFDVISLAGGFRDNADLRRLRVVRDDGVVQVNARRTLEQGGTDLALALRSGDRVLVPQARGFGVRDVLYAVQTVLLVVTIAGRM
jgi:protein involved in polysaccharide export with SLBB domain